MRCENTIYLQPPVRFLGCTYFQKMLFSYNGMWGNRLLRKFTFLCVILSFQIICQATVTQLSTVHVTHRNYWMYYFRLLWYDSMVGFLIAALFWSCATVFFVSYSRFYLTDYWSVIKKPAACLLCQVMVYCERKQKAYAIYNISQPG